MAHANAKWALDKLRDEYGNPKLMWSPKEWKHIHELVKLLDEDFRGTWIAYLGDSSPFYRGHAPSKLAIDHIKFQVQAIPETPKPKIDPLMDPKYRKAVERNVELQRAESAKRRSNQGVRKAMLRSEKVMGKKNLDEAKAALRELKR